MTPLEMAIAALVIAPIIDWIATVILAWYARRLGNVGLHERATTSIILSLAATGIALPSWAYLNDIELGDPGTWLLIGALLLVTVPQVVWLALLALGKFR